MTRMHRRILPGLGLAFTLGALSTTLSLTSCGGDGICSECPDTQLPYRCLDVPGQVITEFCAGSDLLAELECLKQNGTKIEVIDCSSDDEAGHQPWPSGWPFSEVSEVQAGVYSVSRELMEALRDDPSLLYGDSARFVPNSRGYYELRAVAEGDLWALLGFQTGDVFVSLNGHDLLGPEAVLLAFEASRDECRLVITHVRGGVEQATTLLIE